MQALWIDVGYFRQREQNRSGVVDKSLALYPGVPG